MAVPNVKLVLASAVSAVKRNSPPLLGNEDIMVMVENLSADEELDWSFAPGGV